MELVPDAGLAAAQTRREEQELAAAKARMSADEVQRVIDSTRALKAAQLKEDSPEDLATIPRVGLADLERVVKIDPTVVGSLDGGGTLLTHALPTAGVVYADVLLDISKVSAAGASCNHICNHI